MIYWIGGGLILVIVIYLAIVVIQAKMTVRYFPREPMFLCQKHGPQRMDMTVEFNGVKYCGVCWWEKWSPEKHKYL